MATYNRVAGRITNAAARPAGAKKKPAAAHKKGTVSGKPGGCKTKGKKVITSPVIQRTGKRSQRLTSLMHT